jgi:hypothetical protein
MAFLAIPLSAREFQWFAGRIGSRFSNYDLEGGETQ